MGIQGGGDKSQMLHELNSAVQGSVDGVPRKIRVKVITPATPGAPADTGSSGSITTPHGLVRSRIFSAVGKIDYSGGTSYFFQQVNASTQQFFTQVDDTHVTLADINPAYYNSPYTFAIFYFE